MVDQITAEELADRLDAGDPVTLVDTRPEESFDGWRVEGAENVPYDPRDGLSDEQFERVRAIAGDGQVTAICGKGLTSTPFAFDLEERGFDVTVVKGGMEAWTSVYEVVPIETESDLLVRQIQRRGKGCLGYVVGDAGGEAAVVDATRQIGAFEGGRPGEPIEATLGELREHLDLLGLDEDAFVDHLIGNPPEKPENYEQIIRVNTGRESPGSESEATELEVGPNNCAA